MRLSRGPRLVDTIVERLRDGIVTGQFPAGSLLRQVELAEQLAVSRTPLREAFRVLESDGLVRTSDNDGTIEVVAISAEDMREMFQLREVIDGLGARLAAKHGLTPSEERHARELLDELDSTTERYVPEERNRLHCQFHELIARASRNARVESFIPLIHTSSAALYMPAIRHVMAENAEITEHDTTFKEALREAQRQHREILQWILEGSQEKAEEAARVHIQRTLLLCPNLNQLFEASKAESEQTA